MQNFENQEHIIFHGDAIITFLLTIILCLLLCDNLQAQINEGIINYEIITVVEYGIDEKLAELAERDTALAQSLKQEIDDFFKDKLISSSDTIGRVNMTYHFDNKRVRIIDNPIYRTPAFEVYDLQTLEKEVRRMIKGQLNVDTLFYHSIKGRTYEMSIDTDNTRDILGFKCFQVNVVKTELASNIKTEYEMYVTKDILFPPSVVCNWSHNLIEYCALEIKEWVNDDKRNYNLYKVLKFNEEVNQEVFDIPANMIKN